MKSECERNQLRRFSDLFSIIGGGTPKTSVPEYWNGDIPWLSVKDFCGDRKFVYSAEKSITQLGLDNSSTKLLQAGDIIVSARGTVGELAMVGKTMAFNQSCFGLRAKEGIDEHYLYYLTQTKINELKKLSHGSVFDTITRETFEKVTCHVPPLPAQRNIASILSALDDKIETNNAICRNLEEQAMALYESWFVEFEPFQNQGFSYSEKGFIPTEWTVGRLSDLANVISGKRPIIRTSGIDKQINIPILGASGIMGYTNASLYCSKILVIGRVGTLGVVQRFEKECWPSDNALVIQSQYYEYINQVLTRFDYSAIKRGSTQPLITQTDIKNICIIIPPQDILNNFEKRIEKNMKLHSRLKLENIKLSGIRDTLLPKLMNGDIDIKETER